MSSSNGPSPVISPTHKLDLGSSTTSTLSSSSSFSPYSSYSNVKSPTSPSLPSHHHSTSTYHGSLYRRLRSSRTLLLLLIFTCLILPAYFLLYARSEESSPQNLPFSLDNNTKSTSTKSSSSFNNDRIYPVSRPDFNKLPFDKPDNDDNINNNNNNINDGNEALIIDEQDMEGNDNDIPPTVTDIPEIPKVKKPKYPPSQDSIDRVNWLGNNRPAAEVDAQVCPQMGGKPCRFLVPGFVGEQESKAQMHLYQLGLLALTLNRTLVLPNLSGSRLGTCFKHPFDFYYDYASFDRLGIPSITQSDFLAWANARDVRPDAQPVKVVSTNPSYPEGSVQYESPSKEQTQCLADSLDFSSWSPMHVYPPLEFAHTSQDRSAFGKSLVDTLKSDQSRGRLIQQEQGQDEQQQEQDQKQLGPDPSVLVFNYGLRYEILSPKMLRIILSQEAAASGSGDSNAIPVVAPYSHFRYAPSLSSLSQHVASLLSPFAAVHWRQETLSPDSIEPCAKGLVDHLHKLSKQHPKLKAVYLATDYPLEILDQEKQNDTASATSSSSNGNGNGNDDGAVNDDKILAHSGTFTNTLTSKHHKAMRNFLDSFEKSDLDIQLVTYDRLVASGRLQETLPESLSKSFPQDLGGVDLGSVDAGLLGIVDKEVAVRANIFIVGKDDAGPSSCAKRSSFTHQIIDERNKKSASSSKFYVPQPDVWTRG